MMIKSIPIALFLLAATCYPCLAADFVLIVNRSNPVSTVSMRDARNIFLGKKMTWANGESIVVSIQKNTDVTTEFAREILNKSPQQLSLYWRKVLFTGTGIPPVQLKTDNEVKSFVASREGAIGYIAKNSLDKAVKALEVR